MTQTVIPPDFFKAIKQNTESNLDALTRGAANDSVPVGTILMYGGSVPPPGYLICDGAEVNRITYGVLFGVLGTRYGIGDGSTTFNLPDLRNRFVLGMYPGTPPGSALAQTGGEQFHTLTTAEIPSHGHGIDDPGHKHAVHGNFGSGSLAAFTYAGNTFLNADTAFEEAAFTGITGTGGAGGGGSHNNMPPYIALNFIVAVGSG